jgi:glycosyltransferase involved in cell wall biosynthesis
VYNGESVLEETLRSAVMQSYPLIELVIVDGGSTDNTVNIARKFTERTGTLISEKDKGIYDAMNKGIRAAKGEWIYFLNAGDSFYDNGVLQAVFHSIPNQVDLVYGKVQTVNEPTGINYINGKEVTFSDFYRGYPICHQAAFFRKRSFERIGLYNDSYKLVADSEWFVRFFRANGEAMFVDKIIAFYDIQGASYHKRMLSQRELLRYGNRYFPLPVAVSNILLYPVVYLKVWFIRTFQGTAWFKLYREWKFKNRKVVA